MAAYETSTTSLKTLLSNPLLSPDRVERTTEDLAEALASQREVDDAIRIGGAVAMGGTSVGDIDEGELESELEALVQEEKEKEAAKVRIAEVEKQKKLEAVKKAEMEKTKAALPSVPVTESGSQPAKSAQGEDEWQKRYENAQTRDREEKGRADAERLKKEEKRVMEVSQ